MTYFIIGYGFMALCTWLALPYSSPFMSNEEKFYESIGHAISAVLWPIVITTKLIRKILDD